MTSQSSRRLTVEITPTPMSTSVTSKNHAFEMSSKQGVATPCTEISKKHAFVMSTQQGVATPC